MQSTSRQKMSSLDRVLNPILLDEALHPVLERKLLLFEDCLFKPLGGCQKGLLGEFGKFPLKLLMLIEQFAETFVIPEQILPDSPFIHSLFLLGIP